MERERGGEREREREVGMLRGVKEAYGISFVSLLFLRLLLLFFFW